MKSRSSAIWQFYLTRRLFLLTKFPGIFAFFSSSLDDHSRTSLFSVPLKMLDHFRRAATF
jgi:hypothetical protein